MTLPADYEGPRTPTEQEWPAVCELIVSIFFPKATDGWAAYRDWPMTLLPDVRENSLAIWKDGQPVSQIGRVVREVVVQGHTLRLGYVGAVCTQATHRGQGCASAILDAVLNRFDADGVDIVYISGGRPLYYGAGANQASLEERFRPAPEGFATSAPAVELAQATVGDVDTLIALTAREAVRFLRPRLDFELALQQGHCRGRQAVFHLVRWQGQPVGYLLALYFAPQNIWRVTDVVGDRFLLLDAVNQVRRSVPGDQAFEVHLPHRDPMGGLLRAAGVEEIVRPPVGGTVKLLNPARTVAKLWPYFQERVTGLDACPPHLALTRDRYVIWCDGGSLQVTGESNLLWLLLGRPADKPFEGVQVSGRMAEIVERCLPLPLPGLALT